MGDSIYIPEGHYKRTLSHIKRAPRVVWLRDLDVDATEGKVVLLDHWDHEPGDPLVLIDPETRSVREAHTTKAELVLVEQLSKSERDLLPGRHDPHQRVTVLGWR